MAGEGEQPGEGEEEEGVAAQPAGSEGGDDVPELMELCDAAEEAVEEPAKLLDVVRDIGRRLRLSPGDRDHLSDFEGIGHLCTALAAPPHEWRGEAMLAFCRLTPEVCRTSVVNRSSLRDGGFIAAAVGLLRRATDEGDEPAAIAASIAISATCTASDGNKRAAARLPGGEDPEDGADPGDSALVVLPNALARFPESAALQAEGISALRSLVTDDDPRRAECEPAAAGNREVVTSDAGLAFVAAALERAFTLLDASDRPLVKLREQTLLLLREVSRRQDLVHGLAFGAKFLPRALAATEAEDARVVRAGLAVLRNFSCNEEVRDELTLLGDGAQRCARAVARHLATPAVCEQGFGLFANLTMRPSPIAAALAGNEPGLVDLGLRVLRAHPGRPDVSRVATHALRNTATQDEAAAREVKESGIFEEVRRTVREHESDAKWRACVDISRQFLREFRADEGMEKKAQYNQFY